VCDGVGSVSVLLEGLGATGELIEEVLATMKALREGEKNGMTNNARILRDAHAITGWQEREEQDVAAGGFSPMAIDELLETEGGRAIAGKILLKR
jgi:hypothetical protein